MKIKDQFDSLVREYRESDCPERRADIYRRMTELLESGGEEAAEAYRQSFEAFCDEVHEVSLRQSLEFVLKSVSLSFIAREYFGKSHAWLSQRINGNKVNGKPAQFTDEERETLRLALRDIAARIMRVVDDI